MSEQTSESTPDNEKETNPNQAASNSESTVEVDVQSEAQPEVDPEADSDRFDEPTKPRRRGLRIAAVFGGVLLVAAGGIFVLQAGAADSEAEADATTESAEATEEETAKVPIPVDAQAVTQGEISDYLTTTGNLIAEHDVIVLAEAEGRLARMAVEEGQSVGKGQILAELAHGDAQIAIEKATVKESNARRALERAQGMIDQDLISREEFDRFTLDHEVARQELAEAQWQKSRATIRAPFSGRLTRRIAQAGQHVRPGDELFQVTDFEPLIARIHLPEKDILDLDEGREVAITLNADSGVQFKGRIRQISPVVDTATGTVKVTVEAVAPPRAVRPGSFVAIQIARETHGDALLLPREAVLRELKTAHVFVADENSEGGSSLRTAVKRVVELGIEDEDFVQILAGVEAGDLVIVAGQGSLKDGSAIKLMDSAG